MLGLIRDFFQQPDDVGRPLSEADNYYDVSGSRVPLCEWELEDYYESWCAITEEQRNRLESKSCMYWPNGCNEPARERWLYEQATALAAAQSATEVSCENVAG